MSAQPVLKGGSKLPLGILAWIGNAARHSVALPLAALATLVVFVINEATYYRSKDQLAEASAQASVRTQIQNLQRLMLDAESGQRGYLLTSRDEYLVPYDEALGKIDDLLGELSVTFNDDPQTEVIMAELEKRSREKLAELATTLEARSQGREETWRALMLSDIGREKMQAVRETSMTLFEIQEQRVAVLREKLFRNFLIERFGVDVMAALSVFSLFMFLRQYAAFDEARRIHARYLESEKVRLEEQILRRTDELTQLAKHLQSAREDERARLARELHDELGALLTAAKLDAARLKRALGVMPADIAERLLHLNKAIDQGIALKRNIIENLRPSSLTNLGLTAALDIQLREFQRRSDIEVESHLEPTVEASDAVEITIYRFVQESLTNIAKHAHARHVTVDMTFDGDRVRVGIKDDGRGFDPATAKPSAHGLLGMRYRVESDGGEFRVTSAPGQGTLLEAWLPAERAAPSSRLDNLV